MHAIKKSKINEFFDSILEIFVFCGFVTKKRTFVTRKVLTPKSSKASVREGNDKK